METNDFPVLDAAFHQLADRRFDSAAVESFLQQLEVKFPQVADFQPIANLLRKVGRVDPQPMRLPMIGPHDQPFADSISGFTLQNLTLPVISATESRHVRVTGEDLDFLGNTCFPSEMSMFQVLNLLFMRQILPSRKVALVAAVRDEGPYLLEWIAFYRAIGIQDFFLYTNDNGDASDELLELLSAAGVIRLFRNVVRSEMIVQRKAYQHALHLLRELRDFEWALFLDADEFLIPDQRYDFHFAGLVEELERTFPKDKPGALLFPWDWRFDQPTLRKTHGLLFQRFRHSVLHPRMKSLTRLNATIGMCELHIPTTEETTLFVGSDFAPIDKQSVWDLPPLPADRGRIAHFWGKSFEEFAMKRLRPGDRSMPLEFKQYFEWSAETSRENYHPVSPVILERTARGVQELNELPGVADAIKHIEARFNERSCEFENSSQLSSIFEESRGQFKPLFLTGLPAINDSLSISSRSSRNCELIAERLFVFLEADKIRYHRFNSRLENTAFNVN